MEIIINLMLALNHTAAYSHRGSIINNCVPFFVTEILVVVATFGGT